MFMQLVRFAGVGGLATLVHVCVALIANSVFGLDGLVANFSGFIAAVLLSYFGHARITFQTRPDHAQHMPRFLFVSLVGLLTSSSVVWLITERMGQGFGLSMALVAIAVPLASFFAMKFWVFAQHRQKIRLDWTSILISAAVAMVFLLVYWSRPHHHDVAWYLVATEKLLAGAVLYVDVFEINPPLNFFLTVPAVLLSKLPGVSLVNGQYLFVAVLTAGSLAWSGHILRDADLLPHRTRAIFLVLMGFGVTVAAINNIAQREHLLVLLILPWLVGQLSGSIGPRSILPALVAAVGICLKPHFLIFPILMLGRDIWRNRSLRPVIWPEYMSMLAIGVSYALYVALVHPLYLSEIIPTGQVVYGVYGTEFSNVLNSIRVPVGFALIILVPNLIRPVQGSGVFALAVVGGLISYLVQGKGFLYHLVPMFSFVILAGFWIGLSTRTLWSARLLSVIATSIACTIVISFQFYGNGLKDDVIKVARDLNVTGPLLTASEGLDAGPAAALELGLDWASRYPAQWVYPGALEMQTRTDCATQAELCNTIDGLLERNRQRMMDDLNIYQPELIAVSRNKLTQVTTFTSWIAFMRPHPEFEPFMSNYKLVRSTNHHGFFLRIGREIETQ
ncbi:GtrA family protein [Aliiroseovarius sp. S253]|uniref:GtrA family protein n=1 Tax=Aliiroseovarius sp. S253 TaxID=3415133 RepID=UPI003C7DE4C5